MKITVIITAATLALSGVIVGTRLHGLTSTVSSATTTLANITAVQTGRNHLVALDDQGQVYTKGFNGHGETGTNTGIQSVTDWAKVNIPEKVTQISSTTSHTFAITESNHLYAWGENDYGQLGTGGTSDGFTPQQVTAGMRYTSLSVGNNFAVAVSERNELTVWGDNDKGQLGTGNTDPADTPTVISLPNNAVPKAVYAGNGFALAIDTVGRAYSWGDNAAGQLGVGDTNPRLSPTPLKTNQLWSSFSTSPSATTVLGISQRGALFSWGNNDNGQLGNGVDWRQQQIDENNRVEQQKKDIKASDEARKNDLITTCVNDGLQKRYDAWREARAKQQNDSSAAPSPTPASPSPSPSASPSPSPSVDPNAPFVNDSNLPLEQREGYIDCKTEVESTFEYTDVSGITPATITEPALPGNADTPQYIYTPYGINSVAVNATNGYAIDRIGRLYAWGKDGNGLTGLNIKDDASHTQTPQKIADRISSVSAGGSVAFAVSTKNELLAWGDNSKDLLQRGNEDPVLTPTQITSNVATVSAYERSVIITQTNGQGQGWGDNKNKRLGVGSPDEYVTAPTNTTANLSVYQMSDTAGLGLDGGNTLAYWGINSQNLFSLADTAVTADSITLRQILTFATAYAGNKTSLAYDTEGRAWEWGRLIGQHTATTHPLQASVPNADKVVSALGAYATYDNNSKLLSLWGTNVGGSATVENVADIALANDYLWVLTSDGKVFYANYRAGGLNLLPLNDHTYKQIAAGNNLSALIETDGKVELYNTSDTVAPLVEADQTALGNLWKTDAEQISVSKNLIAVVDENGVVWSAGYSPYGVFPSASSSATFLSLPVSTETSN